MHASPTHRPSATSLVAVAALSMPAAAAELQPFDQPANVRWVAGGRGVAGRAVLDSSASALGAHGVQVVAVLYSSPERLVRLDLDLLLDPARLPPGRTLPVGEAARVGYRELVAGRGAAFVSAQAAGEVRVERLLRTTEVAAVALSFSLELTDAAGLVRRLEDGALVTEPAPRDYRAGHRPAVVSDQPVVVDSELEVGMGCDGEPVETGDAYGEDGGCGGDQIGPGPAGSEASGCEGDPSGSAVAEGGEGCDGGGPGGGGEDAGAGCEGDPGPPEGGQGTGCEGDPALRAARVHGPIGLVLAWLSARRLRPRRRRTR